MATDLAKLVVRLEAESAKLTTELEKANKKLDKFGKSAKKATDTFSNGFKALAGVVSAGVLVGLTKHSLDYADSIADAAEQTAFSAEKIQELKFAADQSGISFETLVGALGRFTKRVGLARGAGGAAADTYKKLGIDLSQTSDQVFTQVAETLGNMDNATNRLAISTRLFGDDAQRMGVLLQNGNQGLQEFADKAHDLGLVLSDDIVQGASDANDQLAIMKQVVNAQTVKIFTELAPVITRVGQAFADAAPHVADFFSGFGETSDLTQGAAEIRLRNLERDIERTQDRLRRRLTIDANPGLATRPSDLFLPSAEELNADLDRYLQDKAEVLRRLHDIDSQAQNAAAPTAPEALDTSTLFGSGATANSTKQIDALIAKLKEEAATIGLSAREITAYQLAKAGAGTETLALAASLQDDIDAAKAIAEVEKENQRIFEESAKAVAEYDRELDNFADTLTRAHNPAQDVADQLARIEEAFDTGRISADVYFSAIADQMGRLDESIGEGLEQTTSIAEELGLTFTSAFEDAIVAGNSLSDVLKGLEQDIIRIITRQLVTEPLANSITGLLDGGSLFGIPFGGGKASGGPVDFATPYMVGEAGPELFVPRSAGAIVPNSQLGGKTVNISMTIQTPNADSFRASQRQIIEDAQRAVTAY